MTQLGDVDISDLLGMKEPYTVREFLDQRLSSPTLTTRILERIVGPIPIPTCAPAAELLPCPFCGGAAGIGIASECGDGAYVVACTTPTCLASSKVIFAVKDDPSELLFEAWNRRAAADEIEALQLIIKENARTAARRAKAVPPSGEGDLGCDAGASPILPDQASPPASDYTAMNGPELLAACRDDAAKWAAAFCQHAKKYHSLDIDEGWMIGWFANAIENSTDVRTGSGPTVLPDGSAFFVGRVK